MEIVAEKIYYGKLRRIEIPPGRGKGKERGWLELGRRRKGPHRGFDSIETVHLQRTKSHVSLFTTTKGERVRNTPTFENI